MHSHIEHLNDINFITAILSGIAIAIIAGILGCFVVWRRMAYFGDSLAHSSLLGIALGLITGLGVNIGIIIICSFFALILVLLQHKKILTTDTLLGILAHSSLAVGMVAMSLMGRADFDLHDYLFGDILDVSNTELYWILIGGLIVLFSIIKNWSKILLTTINEDLARAEGINTLIIHMLLMFLMTITVAVSINIIGVLLITSLLIIPAAAARQITRSPEMMAGFATIIGVISVISGIFIAHDFYIPSGPAIVTVATIIFLISIPASLLLRKV